MIYLLNKNSDVTIKCASGEAKEFRANEVVKQGTILAANICANSVDALNKKLLATKNGIKIGKNLIPSQAFQDDKAQTSIVPNKTEELKNITQTFQK